MSIELLGGIMGTLAAVITLLVAAQWLSTRNFDDKYTVTELDMHDRKMMYLMQSESRKASRNNGGY